MTTTTAERLLDGELQPEGDRLLARIIRNLTDTSLYDDEFRQPTRGEQVAVLESYLAAKARRSMIALAA